MLQYHSISGLRKYMFSVSRMPKTYGDWPTTTDMAKQNQRSKLKSQMEMRGRLWVLVQVGNGLYMMRLGCNIVWLTTDVLSLYKAPLCVEGWDEALYEICKLLLDTVLSEQSASVLVKAVEEIPVMVILGAEDALVPLKLVQTMASKFVNCGLVAISGCSHLPHEECPKVLLVAILRFITLVDPMAFETLIPVHYHNNHPWYNTQLSYLYSLFLHLLEKMQTCLAKMGDDLNFNLKFKKDRGWDGYFSILSLLYYVAQKYEDFKSRRHLAMMLLHEVTNDYNNLQEMLINRSNLLAESFESITGAGIAALHGPMHIGFINEEATGHVVLREWFSLVGEAIFNPQNALFVACPTD
nr:PI-PLC X domain-containing protein At5g67130-like [Tanacetum cinerariifolium]